MKAVIAEPGKELTLPQRAAQALVVSRNEQQIRELVEASASITTVANEDGREQCHRAYMVLKNLRIEIESAGKRARDDAVQFSKAVIAEEKRLMDLPAREEKRLQGLRDNWDAEIEREKQRRVDAEVLRIAKLHERIEELRGNQRLSVTEGSKLINQHIEDLTAIPVDESFEEYQQQAADAKVAGLFRLTQLRDAALAHEAEQKRIKEEREELERLRAEQARRDKEDQARRAEEERVAKAARDAEAARVAEENRATRERLEEENRKERERQAAEDARLKAEREQLERDQKALKEAQEAAARAAAPPPAPPEPPPAEPDEPATPATNTSAENLARRFHEIYERLATAFGYKTRPDTRDFDPKSKNGKLMIAVCAEIIEGWP